MIGLRASTRLSAMARNPSDTKERLLDAFDILLDKQGISGATLDAVAAKAGVSKGGLLYHYGSKAELIKGSLERLDRLVDEDVASMKAAGDRLHMYYLETSAETGTPLDRSLIAGAAWRRRMTKRRIHCGRPEKHGSTHLMSISVIPIWR